MRGDLVPNEALELAALGLVLGLVGGTWNQTDRPDRPDGPNGHHDFEIDTDERTMPQEVAATVSRTRRKYIEESSHECRRS